MSPRTTPAGPAGETGRCRRGRGGFSLIEAMFAVALVGLGITALMLSVQAATRANAAGRELTQATYLVQEIREWTLKLPFRDPEQPTAGPGAEAGETEPDDVDDLMGASYSPPRDACGQVIGELAGWSQRIGLEWKDPDSLKTGTVAPGASDIIRVTVTVARDGRDIYSAGWLVARRTTE